MSEFSQLIGDAEQFVRDYGALAVMILIFLEALGAPAPGESLLIFASALAGRGELSFPTLFAGAFMGAVIGDNIGFVVGRHFGRAVALRYGARVGLSADRLASVEAIFKRYGSFAVTFARFFAFVRQLNGFTAGTLDMKWRRFALFDALGVTLWVTTWMAVGGFVGQHAAVLIQFGRRYWPFVLVVAGVALIVFLAVRAKRRASTTSTTEAAQSAASPDP
jgi:membrane protein DedA with SNARE-associated domain